MTEPSKSPVKHSRNQARRTDGTNVGSDWQRMVHHMVDDGLPWDMAAKALNIPLYSARKAMQRPSVLAYLKRTRLELLTTDAPRNFARLREIREQDTNLTAAVAAAKTIHQMAVDADQPTIRQTSPGVIINIVAPDKQVTVAAAPAVIEHQPDSDQDQS